MSERRNARYQGPMRDDERERQAFYSGETRLSTEDSHLSDIRGLLERNAEAQEEVVYSEYVEEKKENRFFRFLRAFLTALFVLGFVGACLFETYTLREEERQLQEACDDIESQIAAEKARVIDYKVDKAYYNSDEYKEGMARNRFRLIYKDEVLIQVHEQ